MVYNTDQTNITHNLLSDAPDRRHLLVLALYLVKLTCFKILC